MNARAPLRVAVATSNPGKLRELRAIFAALGWELAPDPRYREVDEGSESYGDNAARKARALFAASLAAGEPQATLGDDSGLEVDALGGRPGVLSARYGGPDAGWAERRRLLLAELAEVPPERRTARFVCALHLVTARGREFAVERALPGSIVSEQRGSLGFSYDPLFALAADGPTFGELAEAEKNRISHRARAAQALVALVDGADRKM